MNNYFFPVTSKGGHYAQVWLWPFYTNLSPMWPSSQKEFPAPSLEPSHGSIRTYALFRKFKNCVLKDCMSAVCRVGGLSEYDFAQSPNGKWTYLFLSKTMKVLQTCSMRSQVYVTKLAISFFSVSLNPAFESWNRFQSWIVNSFLLLIRRHIWRLDKTSVQEKNEKKLRRVKLLKLLKAI